MRKSPLRYLFAFFSLQSFIALIVTARIPSYGSFLFGFSVSRVAILFILGAIGIALLIVSFMLWRKPQLDQLVDHFMTEKVVNPNFLSTLFIVLVSLAFFSGFPLIFLFPGMWTGIAYQSWRSLQPAVVVRVITRLAPVLIAATLIFFETAIFLGIFYREKLWRRSGWLISTVGPTCIIMVMIGANLFQWFTFCFQFRFFKGIPGWYFGLVYRPFDKYDFVLVAILFVLIGIVLWILLRRGNNFTKLALIFVLGFCLQMSFGFIEGEGLKSLQLKYFNSPHRAYIESAAIETHSFKDIIENYDTYYKQSSFTFTKPPGVMLMYTAIDRLVNGSNYSIGQDARVAKVSDFIVWAFPLFSFTVVFLLFLFMRKLDGSVDNEIVSLIGAVLFVITPSIDLFVLFADQAIYPFVFLLSIFLIVLGLQKRSLILSFLIGCLLYITVLLTFSLTTLLAFTALYILGEGWANRYQRPFWHCFLTGIAVLAGFTLLTAVFQTFLNYNVFQHLIEVQSSRYAFDFYGRVSLPVPTGPISFQERVRQILNADYLNNIEFATSVGFPVFILFVVQGIRVVVHFFQGKTKQIELIQVAFFGTFVAMNFTGSIQGEVARLWMLFVPMVVIFAAREVLPWAKRKPMCLIVLVAAQLLTVALTYHFEDLRM